MTTSKNNSECFKVAVRCRPLNNDEIQNERSSVVSVNPQRGEIQIKQKHDQAEQHRIFAFDQVFEPDIQQEVVYKCIAYPIVESVLEGYNGTIFAYGQTGTGKTHTIQGRNEPINERGIIPRAFEHIFHSIKGSPNTQFLVHVSFLELYNEEIQDLLSTKNKKLELREKAETGVFVKDLTSFLVQNEQELNDKFQQGILNRKVGQTKMSSCSSRSHSILSVTIERCDVVNGENHIKVGKLNLVDLAGSERQSKTQATGSRFKEGVYINLSLTTLGNVISSLIDPKASHIPYRDSKLTRILQDSLGGNTKTVMIANIGPADYNQDETISTLRYAHRAKSIQNHAQINEDPKQAMIRKFQEEISSLKQQLSGLLETGGDFNMNAEVKKIEKIVFKYDDEEIIKLKQKLEQQKSDIENNYENEVKKIEEDKQLQEKEKQQLIYQLQEKEQKQQQQKQQQQKLLGKLQKMQHKVIQGEETMQRVLENERQLNKELQQANERDRQAALQIQQNEDFILEINMKFKNQVEEKQEKQKRINLLFDRLCQIQQQNKDIDEFYVSEIDQLQESYRDLQKELKLKRFILDYFIPQKELKRLSEKAMYSEEQQNWVYPIQNLTGKYMRRSDESQVSLKEIQSEDLEQDSKVYFVYTEQGPIREQFFYTTEIKKQEYAQRKNDPLKQNFEQSNTQFVKTKKRSKSQINQI
ncbi:kinesin motor catalytic domain protein (macronuclear) [Tetrahymena thermophila SB210]|uniref:Kinesin-like protein n=1 Tax=Tetrahymena thermophila (strain SB210) TaxID=312017 RepID=Q22U50_TETTS|nr:kinesin motor catalytic domain protein [Tetrahymena thermophila SB210]EAR88837.1 kinesin motor catalytic domain protein [Tetrahymena thermophila SB210]|eukprot:XP_001009082.1 kinesin motor catalytic domain protein [Tetrahymena thermophila SB210]